MNAVFRVHGAAFIFIFYNLTLSGLTSTVSAPGNKDLPCLRLTGTAAFPRNIACSLLPRLCGPHIPCRILNHILQPCCRRGNAQVGEICTAASVCQIIQQLLTSALCPFHRALPPFLNQQIYSTPSSGHRSGNLRPDLLYMFYHVSTINSTVTPIFLRLAQAFHPAGNHFWKE